MVTCKHSECRVLPDGSAERTRRAVFLDTLKAPSAEDADLSPLNSRSANSLYRVAQTLQPRIGLTYFTGSGRGFFFFLRKISPELTAAIPPHFSEEDWP